MEGESAGKPDGVDARRRGSEVYSNGMSAVCGGAVGRNCNTETFSEYFRSSPFKLMSFLFI